MTGDKKINFGWVIVAYGVLCMLVLHYGTIGSQAIFLLPITKDLGVSTTTLTLASTYSTIVSFIVTPIAGKLMNDKSLKKLLFMGVLGTGATMVAQSYVTSVYAYYAVILVRTVFNPFALMMPFATLAARWFPKESRSFATSIIFVGISLGGVLLSNPLTAAIEMFGWRVTYRCYGFVAMLLVSPLALIFVRDYPDGYDLYQSLSVTSEDIDKVENISRDITKLIESGVEFVSNSPEYYCTKLDEVKLELIEKATDNAKQRIDIMAAGTGSKTGQMLSANLGVFQITAKNSGSGEYSYDGAFDTSSRYKTAMITVKLNYAVE